ncbi:MAG: ParA family protein [SAR324 cluster bacterium]|nr:ParA family protein [SAR324 cluster bacterium]MCZ6558136.1 ParA family protein [SAR324 cluster bacterium]MCZ6627900.1 ParA family protein [SAR324 cluster bacterium]
MINIAILSAKGGTGKTTLAIALAHQYAVSNPNREIILIDADNQGNVGISLDLKTENTLGAYLFQATDTLDMVQYKPSAPFFVVDSGRMHLYEAEKRIHRMDAPVDYFREHLLQEFSANSLLIWDLPPTLSIINDNVLNVADFVIVPTHTDYLSLTGIGNLLSYLEHFRKEHPVKCRLLGIAITLHREHVTQNRLNRESLEAAFPDLMFRSKIPLSTAIATTAQNHLTPLEASEPRARQAYTSLVREIHQRMLKFQEEHG